MNFNKPFAAANTVFALGSGLLNTDITTIDAQTQTDHLSATSQAIDTENPSDDAV